MFLSAITMTGSRPQAMELVLVNWLGTLGFTATWRERLPKPS